MLIVKASERGRPCIVLPFLIQNIMCAERYLFISSKNPSDLLQQRLEQEESVGVSDPYSSVRSVDTERKEQEKIRIWREEQREMLEKKGTNYSWSRVIFY